MEEQNQQTPAPATGQKWGTQYTSRSEAAVAQQRAEKRAADEKAETRTSGWNFAQPSSAMLIWCCVGAVALTLLVGFQWGGWKTTGGAEKLATTATNAAVVERLASICVAQANLDPELAQKLVVLQDTSTYQRATYVSDQNWATMPGDEKPVSKVAEACAKLLVGAEN